MFIEASFTIVKTWKQCVHQRRYGMCIYIYIHTMEYFSAIKNYILPFAVTWMDLERIMGFPCGSAGKESACSVGDLGSIPRLWRSPGEGKDYPLQYSGLEDSKDCRVHEVAKSWTQLSNFQRELCQWNKSDRESQILYIITTFWGIKTNCKWIYSKSEIDSQI